MAAAMNAAKDGRIIADSEEPVRDAHALFRQKAYQKVIDLLAKQRPRRLFPPPQSADEAKWKNKGKQRTSHVTVNGTLEVQRTIYWNKRHGTLAPMDAWLGILRIATAPVCERWPAA